MSGAHESFSNLPSALCCLSSPLNVGVQLRNAQRRNGACPSRVLLGGSSFVSLSPPSKSIYCCSSGGVEFEWDVGNFAGRRLRREEAEATARHYNGKMEAAVDDDDVEAEETDGQIDGR